MLDRNRPSVRWLAGLALAAFGFALPVAMVLANKSAPAVLILATLAGLSAVWLGGAGRQVLDRLRAMLRTQVAMAVLAFAVVAILSLAWSVDRSGTLRGLGIAFLMAAASLLAAAALPLIADHTTGWVLVAGLATASVIAIIDVAAGMRLHALLGERPAFFDLKRSCIVLVLLFWPAARFLAARINAWSAPALAVPLAAAIELISGATAALGLGIGAAALVTARFAPRALILMAAIGVAGVLIAAPFAGPLARHFLASRPVQLFTESHASARVAIWSAFDARFRDRPLLGYGFDASAHVYLVPRPAGVAANAEADATIARLHPHNGFLQIWIELGAAGAIAAALFLAAVLRALARSPVTRLPWHMALLASALVMALVGFGLWQAWWSASVASAAIWFLIVDRTGMS
ncbi:MAG: O-antigen ligase family protein [Methylobacteriaceae bacterium]|nr:O-antigen ligase family protein [Methylobacteriaceae bacterium]